MRKCLFCNQALPGKTRAKEHVLRDSWLRALGHKKSKIGISLMSPVHGNVGVRQHAADQLQTGEVCERCNGGWMNALDLQVERIVLSLAQSTKDQVTLSEADARALSRWLLKVACCFIYTDSPARRHIPQEVLVNLQREDYLPDGFVCFAARSPGKKKHLAIASLDAWPSDFTSPDIAKLPPTKRLKFGVQYDHVVLGCSYVDCEKPQFAGLRGLHIPILEHRARFLLRPATDEEKLNFPPEVQGTFLNVCLMTIGVDSKQGRTIPMYWD